MVVCWWVLMGWVGVDGLGVASTASKHKVRLLCISDRCHIPTVEHLQPPVGQWRRGADVSMY